MSHTIVYAYFISIINAVKIGIDVVAVFYFYIAFYMKLNFAKI